LREELKNMEERSPERKNGEGDRKYKILFEFLKNMGKGVSFSSAYSILSDNEKHVIITRLENQAMKGNIEYDFVDKLSKDLYGVFKDEECVERINFDKKIQLEQSLQD